MEEESLKVVRHLDFLIVNAQEKAVNDVYALHRSLG